MILYIILYYIILFKRFAHSAGPGWYLRVKELLSRIYVFMCYDNEERLYYSNYVIRCYRKYGHGRLFVGFYSIYFCAMPFSSVFVSKTTPRGVRRGTKKGVAQIQVPFLCLRSRLPVGATATLSTIVSILLGTCDKTWFRDSGPELGVVFVF